MDIALLGYGKMGREIEQVLIDRGHRVALKVTSANAATVTAADLQKAQVAIEFSTPHTVLCNINKCLEAGVPVVVGTTGWYGQLATVEQACAEKNGTVFHATNFSLGVNLFFKLNTYLAGLMNKYPAYDVSMEEIHHIHKLDKPSGTAITLAEQVIAQVDRKEQWSIEDEGENTLFIKDVREGEVPGTHIIRYTSAIDDIEIMHKAHNRKGFALGAVIAAEFIYNKKGIFTMKDLL